MNRYRYRLHGATVESELELPELYVEYSGEPSVFIRIGYVPEHLPEVTSSGVLFEAGPDDFLLRLASIGSYRVQNGKKITIDPAKKASPEELRLFLMGSVIGALFHQKGMLPIHGSGIALNNSALLITGNSAVGKSTLAASLMLSGYTPLTDDISVATADENERMVMFPGNRNLKIWKDVSDLLLPEQKMTRVRPQIEKYMIPIERPARQHQSYPIDKIVVLNAKNANGFTMEKIRGAAKMKALRDSIYRDQLIKGLGLMQNHFDLLARLGAQAELYQITRPSRPLLIKELTSFVRKSVLKG